jgi:hypothetical protein
MTPSPFARINAETLRADGRADRIGIGAMALAALLALGLVLIAHMGLQLALHLPDIIATSAAKAAW